MKQVHVARQKAAKKPTVIDERQPPEIPTNNTKPVRTIYYVEMGNAGIEKVKQLTAALKEGYVNNKGEINYVIPLRHGKIISDIVFLHEMLETIRDWCRVDENGQIVFKDNAAEVNVIRTRID